MADNTTFGSGNNATPPAGLVVSLEEITNLNGVAIVTGEKAQRVLPALRTGDGTVVDAPGNATDGITVNLAANNDVTVTSGNVTATQSGNWTARTQDGVGNALTSKSAGAERPLAVAVVDSSGNHVSAFGGSGGTAQADESTFTPGSTNVTPIAATYRATPDTATVNTAAALHMTERRALHVSRRSEATGTELGTETNPEAVRLSSGSSWLTPSQDYQHDASLGTITSVAGPVSVGRASTATPSAVSADDDGVLAWFTRNGAQVVVPAASVVGGATPGKLVSAASTNATNIKASAGKLLFLTASNINAAQRYLKVYNLAGAPTVGTDVPVFTFLIPGNTAGAGTNIPLPTTGINFSTGIAIALTTEATDAGSTGVAANEIIVNYAFI
jgi:hypothetical protein